MANKVFIGSGSMATAANWGNVDSTALVSNNTGSTALTTGNLDATAFTPGAVTVLGVLVRLAARAAGSPSNTMTITLRNTTGAVNVISVTVNVSDLPACTAGANSEGGWHYLKFSASQLLLAATNYTIRATLSSTSTAVSLATNGTANNWQHMLVLNTTGVPAAGDDMFVPQLLDGATNPATAGALSLTIDSTAATDYGSADTSNYVSALSVSKGSTITWGTTAATNYLLRLSGHYKCYSGGVNDIGTTGTPMPRDSTAILEFDCAADWGFYYSGMNGSMTRFQGQSRTSGKNISRTLVTASLSAAATTVNVVDDTGWLNGDAIAISATTRTKTHTDQVALTAGAGASSLTVAALTNAHPYSAAEHVIAEVVLLSRNVTIRAVNSSFATGVVMRATASLDADWALFQYCGATGGQGDAGVVLQTTTGTVSMHHCAMRDLDEGGVVLEGTVASPGSVTIDELTVYRHGVATSSYGVRFMENPAAAGLVAVSNLSVILSVSATSYGISLGLAPTGVPNIAFSGTFRSSSNGDAGLHIVGNWAGATLGGDWHLHSGSAGYGIFSDASWQNCIFSGTVRSWRNANGMGLNGGLSSVYFKDVYVFGNTTNGILCDDVVYDLRFRYLLAAGDSSFSQVEGLQFDTDGYRVLIERGDFGVASGIYVAHTTVDLDYNETGITLEARFIGCVFASATERLPTLPSIAANNLGTVLRFQGEDGTAGNDFTQTSLGTVARETTTVQDSPGIICTPFSATHKLESNGGQRGFGFMVGVLSGATVQVAVSSRKNGAYNGNAPRLVLKSNSACGFPVDVVIDTLSVAADTWETLTGTTGTATADGVLEFVVDGDGTAGAFFANQWTSGSSTPTGDETGWHDGLALRADAVGGAPPAAGDEQAYGYVG